MNSIPQYVYEGLLSVFCIAAVVVIIWKGKKCWRIIGNILLVEYIFLLFCSTVIYRNASDERGCDMMPFWSYRAILDGKEQYLAENIMNVLVFMPIGFLLVTTIKDIRWWKVLLIGLCISIGIESLQFMLMKGFSELDDVMHNTLGCMIGYGIYALARYGYDRLSMRGVGVLKTRKLE